MPVGVLGSPPAVAVTTVTSANGQPWDVEDLGSDDDGSVEDGGQDAFDGFGGLRLQVLDATDAVLVWNQPVHGFGLTHDGARSFATTTPVTFGGVEVGRSLHAPAGTDHLRCVDSFTDTSGAVRKVLVSWGGNLGSDEDTMVVHTSSGDRTLDADDVWAVTCHHPCDKAHPAAGPATDPPVAYAVGRVDPAVRKGPGPYGSNVFGSTYPGTYRDELGFVYELALQPGETARLAYFLYRGLEEGATPPRSGTPPAAAAEIARARDVVSSLAAFLDLSGLTRAEIDSLANWRARSPDLRTRLLTTYRTTGGCAGHAAADVVGDARPTCCPTTRRTGPGG
jgi:hypothetical protein